MSIRLRLILSFTSLVVLPMLFIGIFSIVTIRDTIIDQTVHTLEAIANREHNEIVKHLALFQTDPSQLSAITQNYSGLGKTGETMVIGKDAGGSTYPLTSPRFTAPQERSKLLTIDRIAAQDEERVLRVARDYRGKQVIAVTRQLGNSGWGLVTKIDQEEVLSSFTSFMLFIGGMAVVLVIFFILISWFITQSIFVPIHTLTQKTQEIAQGKLDLELPPEVANSRDEIGQLAQSFLVMTQRIKALYTGLEEKVEEKTETLEHTVEEVEKLKSKDEAILRGIGEGVCAINENGIIILFNESAASMTGVPAKEALGKPYRDVMRLHPENPEDTRLHGTHTDPFIDEALKGNKATFANQQLDVRSGGTLPIAGSAAPVFTQGGQVTGVVIVFRDTTREREIEKLKDEFVSMASHELRTPMTGIKGFIQLVLGRGNLDPKSKELMVLALSTTDRLISLVNDMLDVSRIEGKRLQMNPEKINMQTLTEDAVKSLSILAVNKHLSVNPWDESGEPVVFADRARVSQVLFNLMGNALKFTPEGGSITVSFRKNGDKFATSITDTGMGIKKQDMPKLFSKFGKIVAALPGAASIPGTGLGLYICKKIIELSGGTISATSEEGKGSTFTFTLPVG